MKTLSQLSQQYAPVILEGALVRENILIQVGYVKSQEKNTRKSSAYAECPTPNGVLLVDRRLSPDTQIHSPQDNSTLFKVESKTPADTQIHRSGTKPPISIGEETCRLGARDKTQTTLCEHYSACPQRRCDGSGFWYENQQNGRQLVRRMSYE